ncbi:MAG: YraN family protein [Rectinema sp.]
MKCTVQRGKEGEAVGRRYLIDAGWSVLSSNFRTRRGEIDIIALRGGIVAFVEVKMVNRYTQADLQHVISAKKRRSIIETSKLFLAMNRKYNQYRVRYDVMLVRGNACVRHMEGAFAEHDEAE